MTKKACLVQGGARDFFPLSKSKSALRLRDRKQLTPLYSMVNQRELMTLCVKRGLRKSPKIFHRYFREMNFLHFLFLCTWLSFEPKWRVFQLKETPFHHPQHWSAPKLREIKNKSLRFYTRLTSWTVGDIPYWWIVIYIAHRIQISLALVAFFHSVQSLSLVSLPVSNCHLALSFNYPQRMPWLIAFRYPPGTFASFLLLSKWQFIWPSLSIIHKP